MKIRNLVFTALFAVSMPAAAQQPPSAGGTTGKTAPTTSTTTPTTTPATKDATAKPGKLSQAEIAIVAHLHHVNLMEIDMGKMAQRKGTAAVKKYGAMIVKDHQTADKELLAMAKKRGLTKIPTDKPATEADKADHDKQMAGMKALKTMKAEEFDRNYLAMMIEGHDKELAKSDPAIALAADADLKAMLETRKPMLQRHSDAARELQKGTTTSSAAGTTGAGAGAGTTTTTGSTTGGKTGTSTTTGAKTGTSTGTGTGTATGTKSTTGTTSKGTAQ